jgi:hypothetical protein
MTTVRESDNPGDGSFHAEGGNVRTLTVPLGAAAAAVIITLAVTSMTSRAAGSYADDRAEWAYKGGGNPAW